MPIVYLMIVAGIALLAIGGDLLIRGSIDVARRAGMSPLLIGLTLVGFGTSTPELVTSLNAALVGSPGIAVGNIIGSNISNILLILGVAALLLPIAVAPGGLARDGAMVVAVAILFSALGFVRSLDQLVGGTFLALLVGYVLYAAWYERRAHPEAALADGVVVSTGGSLIGALTLAVTGLAIVIAGGYLLVEGGIALARQVGLSETVIGLTIVAIGTSLPELVTSLIAAIRRHSDLALGNVLGSNIYNILGIGGVTGLIAPVAIPPQIVQFDAPLMVAASLALVLFCWTGGRLSRFEGAILLAGYAAYVFVIWPKG